MYAKSEQEAVCELDRVADGAVVGRRSRNTYSQSWRTSLSGGVHAQSVKMAGLSDPRGSIRRGRAHRGRRISPPRGSCSADSRRALYLPSRGIYRPAAVSADLRARRIARRRTLSALCTPTSVGCTYSGQHLSMNVEKHAKASIWVGMAYKNGAARTFMPAIQTLLSAHCNTKKRRGTVRVRLDPPWT